MEPTKMTTLHLMTVNRRVHLTVRLCQAVLIFRLLVVAAMLLLAETSFAATTGDKSQRAFYSAGLNLSAGGARTLATAEEGPASRSGVLAFCASNPHYFQAANGKPLWLIGAYT
jgi:hypothetical protein